MKLGVFNEFLALIKSRIPFLKASIKPSSFTNSFLWISKGHSNSSNKTVLEIENFLKKSFKSNGSDKSTHHQYHIPYAYVFTTFQEKIGILEIGIGSTDTSFGHNMSWFKGAKSGGSLKTWESSGFFNFVAGADIDSKILFTGKLIRTYYCDQLKLDTLKELKRNLIRDCSYPGIGMIVDDGLHDLEANLNSLSIFWDILIPGGWYAIEDLTSTNLFEIFNSIDKNELEEWAIWGNPVTGPNNFLLLLRKK